MSGPDDMRGRGDGRPNVPGGRHRRAGAEAIGDGTGPRPPQRGEPLPIDPDLHLLALDNGFACWVRPTRGRAGSIAFTLRVGAGSLVEREAERGYAHLLEHLAFGRSSAFSGDELKRFFASRGTRLGQHHNALTGLDHTSYTLSFPRASRAAVEGALACLSGIAFGLALDRRELEHERRVILEELRARDDARGRNRQRLLALLFPGTLLGRRHPLGDPATLEAASAAGLRGFYERWYRPAGSLLLVAGDIDPAWLEAAVRAHFEGWRCAAPPARRRGLRPGPAAQLAAVMIDPQASEARASLHWVRADVQVRTVGDFRHDLVEHVALWLVNRRLAILAAEGRAAFRRAELLVSTLATPWAAGEARATGPAGEAATMLADLAREIERALAGGLSAAELELARAAATSAARHDAQVAEGRSAGEVLAVLERAARGRVPPMSPAQREVLVSAHVAGISPDELVARLRTGFDPSTALLEVELPDAREELSPAALVALVRRVTTEAPRAPVMEGVRGGRLLETTPALRPATERESAPLGVVSATLANGVRLHVRSMESPRNRVVVTVTLAGGRIREGEDTLGSTTAAALAWAQPATRTHSSARIRDFLAVRPIEIATGVDEDLVRLTVDCDRASLEDALQLLHLLLAEPRIEEAALAIWRRRVAEEAERASSSLELRLAGRTLELLTGGDPRFRFLSRERAEAITLNGAQEWLDAMVSRAPLEVGVAGRVPPVQTIERLARYLGGLAARPRHDPGLTRLRRLPAKLAVASDCLWVDSDVPRAAVLTGWRVAPWQSGRERRILRVVELVVERRMHAELRERRALTYAAQCSFAPSRAYPRASLFTIAFYVAPDRVAEASLATDDLVAGLLGTGPTEAEVTEARRHLILTLRRLRREPAYWSRLLGELDYRRATVRELGETESALRAIRPADVTAVLRRDLTAARRIRLTARPRGAP